MNDEVSSKRAKNFLWLSIVSFGVVVAIAWLCFPAVVRDARLQLRDDTPIEFPYTFESSPGLYIVKATLVKNWRTPPFLSLSADDLIESVSLDGKIIGQFTNWPVKFHRTTLPPDLASGDHMLKIDVHCASRFGWIDIRQAHGLGLAFAIAVLFGAALWFWWTWKRNLPLWSGWFGAVAILLGSVYFLSTGPWVRQNDVDGHREYISYILENAAIPSVQLGWETWQPPFYYLISAFWVKLWQWLARMETFRLVQLQSLLFYLASSAVAILNWRRFQFPGRIAWLGLAVFLFLPAHLYLSGKVNNDSLMPLWGATLTLLAWHYVENGAFSTVIWMSWALLGAMMTKTSSLSLCVGAGLILLWADYARGRRYSEQVVRAVTLAWPSLIWFAFWCVRNHDQTGQWLYVNANLPASLGVENNVSRFLTFVPSMFFHVKSIYSPDVRGSLPSALYLSLFNGDFNYDHLRDSVLPLAPVFFLPLAVLFFIGLATPPRRSVLRPWVPASLLFAAHAGFMLLYCINYPFACNHDARLWSPVFFPAAVLLTWGYEVASTKVQGIGRIVLNSLVLVALSVLVPFYLEIVTY